MTAGRRINVNFTDEAYETLKELAKLRDKTFSDVIRDAVWLEALFTRATQEGERFLIERPDGGIREIVRP